MGLTIELSLFCLYLHSRRFIHTFHTSILRAYFNEWAFLFTILLVFVQIRVNFVIQIDRYGI